MNVRSLTLIVLALPFLALSTTLRAAAPAAAPATAGQDVLLRALRKSSSAPSTSSGRGKTPMYSCPTRPSSNPSTSGPCRAIRYESDNHSRRPPWTRVGDTSDNTHQIKEGAAGAAATSTASG